jgi:SCY1-like protein 1
MISKPSTATTPLVSSGLRPSTARTSTSSNNPFASPPPETEDDFDTSWGDTIADDNADEAWGAMDDSDPFSAPITKSTTAPNPPPLLDDKGEPDFSGWLNKQAGTKTTKKPLPKGLVKTSAAAAARPGIPAKVNSTGGVKKVLPAAKPKPVVKKEEVKEEEADDAWGDAW